MTHPSSTSPVLVSLKDKIYVNAEARDRVAILLFYYQRVNVRIALGSCQEKAGAPRRLWEGGFRAWEGHSSSVETYILSPLNWGYLGLPEKGIIYRHSSASGLWGSLNGAERCGMERTWEGPHHG